jgi:restriction endonuclease S subunit
VKVENDGFDLGAQRRRIEQNDLPVALQALIEYRSTLRAPGSTLSPCVTRKRLLESADCNLSGARYRQTVVRATAKWPMVKLREVCCFVSDGDWVETKDQSDDGIRLIQTGNIGMGEYLEKCDKARFISETKFKELNCTEVFPGDVLVSRLPDPVGRASRTPVLRYRMITAVDCTILRFEPQKILPDLFVGYTLSAKYYEQLATFLTGTSRQRISRKNLEQIEIPLPPLDVQEKIVAELDGYRKVIEGARQVIANYKPTIKIDSEWPMAELCDLVHLVSSGATPLGGKENYLKCGILFIRSQNVLRGHCDFSNVAFISPELHQDMSRSCVRKHDILLNITGASIGRCAVYDEDDEANVNQHVCIIRPKQDALDPHYLCSLINEPEFQNFIMRTQSGASRQALNYQQIRNFCVALPPLDVQRRIAAELEAERTLVEASRELIARMEKKIQSRLAEIWGEEENGRKEVQKE